jgi:putative Holliday junction resolvase
MGILARAYDTLRFRDDDYEKAIEYTIDICKKEKVSTVVLGLPKHMNGDEGVRAQISFDFKAEIEKRSDIKVVLMDERLTTVIVDKAMISANVRRKDRHEKKDEMAAVVILQNYLDKKSF